MFSPASEILLHGVNLFCEHCSSLCVRLIKSQRAGVGKTLRVRRFAEALQEAVSSRSDIRSSLVTVSLHSRVVDESDVLKLLIEHCTEPEDKVITIFHINIAPQVSYFTLF